MVEFKEPRDRIDLSLSLKELNVSDLKTYFELLQNFPEYREAEFTLKEGFFNYSQTKTLLELIQETVTSKGARYH